MNRTILAVALTCAVAAGTAQADITLGAFNFNSSQFGNTLAQSDGGTFAGSNWLNVVNADPGSPGYLTGANFNTGIANIGLGGSPIYTIGYTTPIVNGAGNDLGIVTARYSSGDTISLAVSQDAGTTFSGPLSFGPGLASATGVACDYFYGGGGPFACNLFVTEVDLSDFGVALGASINAVQVGGAPELDLIRVAGLGDAGVVPEPAGLALLGTALAALALGRRRVR